MDRVPSLETTEQLLAHTAWLTRVARALTHSAEDAEEVVQQTWLKALERPPAHGGDLKGWLATLARNLVRSRRRSSEREAARVRALPQPEAERGPEESVARAELQQVLLDAVLALAEPYRSTLVMRFLDELSAEEIAQKSGAPVETVRTRVKRGLDQVRARVAQKLGAEREQLPALFAPLFAAGVVVVTSTTKVGLLIGAAAAVLATTFVLTRAKVEGGARGEESAARSPAPAAAAVARLSDPPAAARLAETATATRLIDGAKPPITREASPPATFDLAGVVVDARGAPLPDATIALVHADSKFFRNTPGPVLSQSTVARRFEKDGAILRTSDQDGAFTVSEIDRFQRWRIFALRADRGSSLLVDVDPARDAMPQRIRLSLVPAIALRGRVVDGDGHPVSGASIGLFWPDPDPGRPDSSLATSLDCDASGAFVVEPVSAPWIELTAIRGLVFSAPTRLAASGSNDPQEITIRLVSQVEVLQFHGRIVDLEGMPIANSTSFQSRLSQSKHASDFIKSWQAVLVGGTVPAIGTTKPEFIRSCLIDRATGGFTLDFERRDDDSAEPTAVAIVANQRVVAVLALDEALMQPSDVPHELPDLAVDAASLAADPSVGSIRVRATDAATGALIDGFNVELTTWSSDGHQLESQYGGNTASFNELPLGRGVLVASSSGYAPAWTEFEVVANGETPTLTIPLTRSARSIRGTVFDPDHHPVVHARVWWLEPDGDGWRRSAVAPKETGSEGRFAFEGVGAGRGRVAIETPDFVPAMADVAPLAPGEGDVAPLEIVLTHGAAVTFRLVTGSGSPASLLRITAADRNVVWQEWSSVKTGWISEPKRRITLAPGRYHYELAISRGDDATGDFEAVDGAEIVITPTAR